MNDGRSFASRSGHGLWSELRGPGPNFRTRSRSRPTSCLLRSADEDVNNQNAPQLRERRFPLPVLLRKVEVCEPRKHEQQTVISQTEPAFGRDPSPPTLP
jgi:hypothetical protein